MKTADFRGELTPNGLIAVPPEIASQVPPGEQIFKLYSSGGPPPKTITSGARWGSGSLKRHMPPMTQSTNC